MTPLPTATRRGARKGLLVASVALLALASRPARADDTHANALAEQLFLEGRALAQEHRYEEACAKFKTAHDLDQTATGTLLNLALCHEATNHTASAWAEFRQVVAESQRRPDRVALAREHEEKLAPKLSRLTVEVPSSSLVPGLEVRIDGGKPMGSEAWGTALPLDPGEHVVAATAPGKVTAEQRVVLGASADRKRIVVARLEDAPLPPPAARAAREVDVRAAADESARRTRRTIGIALGAAGVATVAVGLAFGRSAAKSNDEARSLCPDDRCPSAQAKDDASRTLARANGSADVANVLCGLGGAALLGGGLLVVTAWPRSAPVRATVTTARDGGGILVQGAF